MRADKSLKPFEIRLYRHYRVVHGVRIALAFVLTFLLVRLLNVPEGTWPLITLVVVMGPISFWGNVVPRAFQRIGGTILGSALGLVALKLELISLPLMVSGILTLTLNHSAFFSEILRSGVSAVGHGQLEAARSLGLGTFKTFRLIVFPQAFKTAMPPLTGQFVALLKETVICSVVGIPELLREALVVQSWTANPTPLIIATIGYLLLLVPLTRLSRYLEVRMSTVRQAC